MKTSIQDLVKQGLHNAEIARVLRIHRSTVTRKLREMGLANPSRPHLILRRRRIQNLHAAGLTVDEIGRALKLTTDQVYRDLRLITEPNKASAKPGQNDISA